jgi:uronate dehydrogenase
VPLLRGCAGVVHLAANPNETSFEEALDSHLRLTHSVLEAMLAAGVPRIVYASSNHAVGFTPRVPMVGAGTRHRPDTFYGVGKAACEALCSLYADRHGLAAVCLRIGTFADRPRTRRDLSTWLSPGDAVRLVEASLTAPAVHFSVV